MSIETGKSLVQVSELPPATRLSIGLFRLESAIDVAVAQRIQIDECRQMIKDALLYDSPFETEIKGKLGDARAVLAVMAGDDTKRKTPTDLDDHVDNELDPWKSSRIPSQHDTEQAKTIAREIARTLHPDTSDEVTDRAFGDSKMQLYDEALKAAEDGDLRKAERILVETKGTFLLETLKTKLANGMSLDQIAAENPGLIRDIEAMSYLGIKVAKDQTILDKERVERQADSIKDRTEVYSRSIAYAYCVQTLEQAINIYGDRGRKPIKVKGESDVFGSASQVLKEACESVSDEFLGSFSKSKIYQDALDATLRKFAQIVSDLVNAVGADENPTEHVQQAINQAMSIAVAAAGLVASLRREAVISGHFSFSKESKVNNLINFEKIIRNNY